MNITIKILGGADLGVLGNVAPGVFDRAIDLRRTEEFLADPRHHLVVALDADLVVGFASAVHYVHPDRPQPEMWINEIGVEPTRRNRGLGKGLVRALLNLARDLGCAEAWVLSERSNGAAVRLYSELGGVDAPAGLAMFNFRLEGAAAKSPE
jgi:ribosomal protein S18 acetylase RimI-like enzyme